MNRYRNLGPCILAMMPFLLAGCLSAKNAENGSQTAGSRGGYVVTEEDIEAAGSTSIEELLIARVPGVRRAPDGGGIILRGPDSVHGSNAPLYVIDGVPSASGARYISLYDIAEIEVLTDMSTIAGYGMQGMNGVILVRTKLSEP